MEALNLTREQVEQMPAGENLNALVAEHVMGMQWINIVSPVDSQDFENILLAPSELPAWRRLYPALSLGFNPAGNQSRWIGAGEYSTDIAAAWQVVEAMEATHTVACGLQARYKRTEDGPMTRTGWVARFTPIGRVALDFSGPQAATAPLAICRAALLAALSASLLSQEGGRDGEAT